MAKDPAFLFYPDNFMSGTMFMSDEQVGKYMRLLCAQHLTGHLSEKHMLIICKSYDEDIWNKFEKDGDGNYFNIRLENEIIKRQNFSDSRKANRIGKTKDLKKTSKKQVKNKSITYDNHMGNGNENGNINEIVKSTFSENFMFHWKKWIEYKKLQHNFTFKQIRYEQTSINELEKLSGGNEEIAIKIIDTSIAKGWKGLFRLDTKTQIQTPEPIGKRYREL